MALLRLGSHRSTTPRSLSAMGLDSVVVATAAEAARALRAAGIGPRLIDARIDPSSYAPLIAATRG